MKLQHKLILSLSFLILSFSAWGADLNKENPILLPKTITTIYAEGPGAIGRKDIYEFKYDAQNRLIEEISTCYDDDYTVVYRKDYKRISYNEDGLPAIFYIEMNHIHDGEVKFCDKGEELFSYEGSLVKMNMIGSSRSHGFTIGKDNLKVTDDSKPTKMKFDNKNGMFKNVNSMPWVLELLDEEYELLIIHNDLGDEQFDKIYEYNEDGYPISYKQVDRENKELDKKVTIEYIRK